MIGIGTAFIAAGYSNIMNYIQALFSYFNAPLFATFIIAMFWKRTTPWAGFWGLVAGTVGAFVFGNFIGPNLAYFHAGSDHGRRAERPDGQLLRRHHRVRGRRDRHRDRHPGDHLRNRSRNWRGLVWGVPDPNAGDPHEGYVRKWYESPKLLGFTALGITLVLSILIEVI